MFMINTVSQEEANGKMKLIYKNMQEAFGFLPPHTKLFATLDLQGLEEFFRLNIYLNTHKFIDSELLPFIRLYIAQSNCREYCKKFNTKLLLSKGIKKNLIKNIVEQFDDIPFNDAQKTLAKKVLKAIYQTDSFQKDDLEELYKYNFSDKDFYDLLNYATTFMVKSKIIDIYMNKK